MLKQLLKNIIRSAGYKVNSTKYVLKQFEDDKHLLKLDFDHTLSKYLVHKKDNPSEFVFIQVGAFDGVMCDPLVTYLNKYDWKGIMLEPQPAPYERLRNMYADRKSISVRNAALSEENGKATLYTLDGDDLPEWAKGMASFSRENIMRHRYLFPRIADHIRAVEVETISFERLLKEESVTSLDLLQVDTEGYDAEILLMFPFHQLKPAIIHFESKHIPKPKLEKVLDLLIQHGYKVARDREEDMMAVL